MVKSEFFDQKPKEKTMHVKGFLHKLLSSVMHKKRLDTLIIFVNTLLGSKRLSLTALGREIVLPIQERSGIRRADRFIGNKKLQEELSLIYEKNVEMLIGSKKRPKIIVDWSHVPNNDLNVLRAGLVAKGRALTLYEEVHPEKKLGNRAIEKNFLEKLEMLLPQECKPIIITDAGFRNPWFKKVRELGWDFIGRIRGNPQYFDGKNWISCKAILEKATSTARYLGKILLCKTNSIQVHFYLVKEKRKKKLLKKENAKRKISRSAHQHRKSGKEGWLLCSSLSGNDKVKVKRVIKLYKFRMQIEESFRDLKSSMYGYGFEKAHSRSSDRVSVLLLIALFATLIAYLAGYITEKNKMHYQFQGNSIKKKRILSLFYLGHRAIKAKLKITGIMLQEAIGEITL